MSAPASVDPKEFLLRFEEAAPKPAEIEAPTEPTAEDLERESERAMAFWGGVLGQKG